MSLTSSNPGPQSHASRLYRSLPGSIWGLGLCSMFMDISSELVHSLLPVFMATVLGASMVTIGVVEGIAEAAAAIMKVFSGALSDYFRRRKVLIVLGYGLSAITKPLFPLATTMWWVFAARFVDRTGKGIRGAPRDALIADIVQPADRGAAYGLRQSLDSAGAFLGPLAAVVLMVLFANDITGVLWVAVGPAFLAVLLLIVAVREPESSGRVAGSGTPLTLTGARQLPFHYWLVVGLGAAFTLARFSEAFLILRAQDVGLAVGSVPLVMVVMNIVYAAVAYPAGVAADRLRPRTLLLVGLGMLIGADAALACANSPFPVLVGSALWGLHMALTQGLFSKLVADTASVDLRGTAFGIFNLVSGAALLLASLIAGALWSAFGAPATFVAGAIFAALAVLGLSLYRPGSPSTD